MSIRSISMSGPAASASNAGSQSAQTHETPAPQHDEKNLNAAPTADRPVVAVINRQGQALKFSRDEQTGTRIVKVVDLHSGEVLRQIPSKAVVNFLRQLEKHEGSLASIKS
jgi:flagellar protein FlaG